MLRRLHFQGTAAGAAVAQPLLLISQNGQAGAANNWTAPAKGCIAKILICNDTANQQNAITIVRGNHGGRDITLQAPGDLCADVEMGFDFIDKFGVGIEFDAGEIINLTGNMVGASVCDVFLDIIDGGPSADFQGIRVAGANAAVADADTETGANVRAALSAGRRYRLVGFYGIGAATTKSFGVGLNSNGLVSFQAKSVVVNAGQPYDFIRPDQANNLESVGSTWVSDGRIFINDSAATAAANQVLACLFMVS